MCLSIISERILLMNEKMENIIEVTWVFDQLLLNEEIPEWDIIVETFGRSEIKKIIQRIADDFEKFEYSIVDYESAIRVFAVEKLKDIFSFAKIYPDSETKIVQKSGLLDGVSLCCGYDFGIEEKIVNFCPICGKKL